MKYLTFNDKEEIKEALNNGEVISFPTETVYGLGALSTFMGFKNLVKVKQRREDKPFTLMVSDINMIEKYCNLNSLSRKIIEKFMPGSLTVILKAKENLPKFLSLGTNFIGFRIPDNKDLIELISYIGKSLLVPSANKKDQKPETTADGVYNVFKDELYCIINKDSDVKSKVPSTIVKINNDELTFIRIGTISKEEVLKEIKL